MLGGFVRGFRVYGLGDFRVQASECEIGCNQLLCSAGSVQILFRKGYRT